MSRVACKQPHRQSKPLPESPIRVIADKANVGRSSSDVVFGSTGLEKTRRGAVVAGIRYKLRASVTITAEELTGSSVEMLIPHSV